MSELAPPRIVVSKNESEPVISFGGEGEEDGQLFRPEGVCCDRAGNILVADTSNHRILAFDSKGIFLRKFQIELNFNPGTLVCPKKITLNPEGHLVVADSFCRVQVFKMDGTYMDVIFGEKGTKDGQFLSISAVVCNSAGEIIVSDVKNNRIQIFSATGEFLNKYIFEKFVSVAGVTITQTGDYVVPDANLNRLFFVNTDLRQIRFIGKKGTGQLHFNSPLAIRSDDDGNIIVLDSGNRRVQVMGKNDNFLWEVGNVGEPLGLLSDICILPGGRLVVVDKRLHKVFIL